MNKVPTSEIKEALEYLGIPISESLQKGMEVTALEGSEQNGGGSESNELDKKKAELSSKVEKARKDLEDLEKEQEDLEKGSSTETVVNPPVKKEENDLEKGKELEPLLKTIASQTTLIKSQFQTLEVLTKNMGDLSGKVEEFLSTPQERRSAENLNQLKKSLGFGEVDENIKRTPQNSVSILEKGRLSNILMGIYQETGSSDSSVENMITTYEASGFLSQQAIDLVKSKGIEIIK